MSQIQRTTRWSLNHRTAVFWVVYQISLYYYEYQNNVMKKSKSNKIPSAYSNMLTRPKEALEDETPDCVE